MTVHLTVLGHIAAHLPVAVAYKPVALLLSTGKTCASPEERRYRAALRLAGREFWVEVEARRTGSGMEYRLRSWSGERVNSEALMVLVESLFERGRRGGWLYRGRRWAGRREKLSLVLGPWRLRGEAVYDAEGWLERVVLEGRGVRVEVRAAENASTPSNSSSSPRD